MYTLAIVGVYACLASGGGVTGTGMPSYPAAREAPRSRCDLTLSLSKAPHPLPATPDPLLGKGSIKKGAAASQQLLAHS